MSASLTGNENRSEFAIHVTTVLLSSVLIAVHDYMVTVAVFLFQILTKHEYHGHDLSFMLMELKSMSPPYCSSVLMAVPDYMVTVAVFLFQIMTKHEYHGHDLYVMLAELKSM